MKCFDIRPDPFGEGHHVSTGRLTQEWGYRLTTEQRCRKVRAWECLVVMGVAGVIGGVFAAIAVAVLESRPVG